MSERSPSSVSACTLGKWAAASVVRRAHGPRGARRLRVPWNDVDLIVGGETVRNGYAGYVAGATFAQALGWNGARVATSYAACATGAQALDTARSRILAGESKVALVVGADTTPKGFLAPNAESAERPRLAAVPVARDDQPGLLRALRPPPDGPLRRHQEDFAQVKVKNARHGLNNPNARYRKEVSAEDVLEPRWSPTPCTCSTSARPRTAPQRWWWPAPSTPAARSRQAGAVRRDLDGHPDVPEHRDGHAAAGHRTSGRRSTPGADVQGVDRRRGLRGGRHGP